MKDGIRWLGKQPVPAVNHEEKVLSNNEPSAPGLVRTRLAPPSKLATFSVCPLRYFLETEGLYPALFRPTPASLLGQAVHHAVEQILSGKELGGKNIIALLNSEVERLLDAENSSGPIIHWIVERFGRASLISRRQVIEQAAFAGSLQTRTVPRQPNQRQYQYAASNSIPLGQEKWIQSPRLGAGGRADLISRQEDGSIRITDLKTGRACDDEGNPKAAYFLQLSVYGLIAQELESACMIYLELVSKSDRWIGILDDQAKELAQATLDNLNHALPLGQPVSPTSLFRLGPHCTECSRRPICKFYKDHLLQRMASELKDCGDTALDIAGKVVQIEDEGEWVNIRCSLDNGRLLRISRVPTSLLPDSTQPPGYMLYAFGLRAAERQSPDKFPSNFFVVNPESPRESAFQAVFTVD